MDQLQTYQTMENRAADNRERNQLRSELPRSEPGCCISFFGAILTFFGCLLLLIPIFWFFYIRTVKEYQRAVIFRLGRLIGAKGPGLFVLIPLVDSFTIVDLRVKTMDVPRQEMITKDSVTVTVDAVVYFKIEDPVRAVVNVENYTWSTSLLCQTTLRSVVGQTDLDGLLAHRDSINAQLRDTIEHETKVWGVYVSAVEVKDVQLPDGMQRVMASQAQAERERRAKIISAQGEFEASTRYSEAASIFSREPAALQLRYLQTLTEIAAEKNSTILFPLPMDLLSAFMPKLGSVSKQQTGEASGTQPIAMV